MKPIGIAIFPSSGVISAPRFHVSIIFAAAVSTNFLYKEETFSEPCQTSDMELFEKVLDGFAIA